jgi:hypothetical protein
MQDAAVNCQQLPVNSSLLLRVSLRRNQAALGLCSVHAASAAKLCPQCVAECVTENDGHHGSMILERILHFVKSSGPLHHCLSTEAAAQHVPEKLQNYGCCRDKTGVEIL